MALWTLVPNALCSGQYSFLNFVLSGLWESIYLKHGLAFLKNKLCPEESTKWCMHACGVQASLGTNLSTGHGFWLGRRTTHDLVWCLPTCSIRLEKIQGEKMIPVPGSVCGCLSFQWLHREHLLSPGFCGSGNLVQQLPASSA